MTGTAPDGEVARVLEDLARSLGAGRVTLRRDVADERGRNFPVTDEVLAPGVVSIRDEEYADIFTSPVAVRVAAGEQVVQHDSASCYPDDEEFQAMLGEYGGMGAQVVTPVARGSEVFAIVSVHHLGPARDWAPQELEACAAAARHIAQLLGDG